jgi:membrane fusion protein, copper/silver efflux system
MPLSARTRGEKRELPPGIVGRLQLSPYRITLAGVRTVKTRRFPLTKHVEAPGIVEYEERKLQTISARAGGRIEKLFIDFTGAPVDQGQPLATIYSPVLLSAIQEFQSARKMQRGNPATEGTLAGTGGLADSLEKSALKKLEYLGLTPEQIAALSKSAAPEPSVTVNSPSRGTVTRKYIVSGQYIGEGQPMFDLANLAVVWVWAPVWEEDMPFITIGQSVEARTSVYPGRVFSGRVAFTDFAVDRSTRTLGVRFDITNSDGYLKPGMFLTVSLATPMSEIEPFTAGTSSVTVTPAGNAPTATDTSATIYTCPMHPEIRSATPGKCQICHMALEPVKNDSVSGKDSAPGKASTRLIYVCPMHPSVVSDKPGKCELCKAFMDMDLEPELVSGTTGEVLIVESSAVIDTGERKVVFVEREKGVFDAVEVLLGARCGEFYPIISGLKEGDTVVAAGAFLLDAETRLNPAIGAAITGRQAMPGAGAAGGSGMSVGTTGGAESDPHAGHVNK